MKGLREEANKMSKKKHAQILQVKEEIRTIRKGKPSKKREQIQTEIERLDWKIQTTPLTLEEEKGLIVQVRRLENQLSMYKKLQKLKDDLTELRIEEKKSISEAKEYHTELLGLAEQSQELHKEMVEDLNEADALQVNADIAHQRFLEAKEKTRTIHQRIKPLREELHQIEEENKARNKLELRKVLEERALEKLERGEKLTLEEFKALSEKGVV